MLSIEAADAFTEVERGIEVKWREVWSSDILVYLFSYFRNGTRLGMRPNEPDFMKILLGINVIDIIGGIFDANKTRLGPELLVCCLAHRGPTGVFLLLRS